MDTLNSLVNGCMLKLRESDSPSFFKLEAILAASHKNVLGYITQNMSDKSSLAVRCVCSLCYRLTLNSHEVETIINKYEPNNQTLFLQLELYAALYEIKAIAEHLQQCSHDSDGHDVGKFYNDVLAMLIEIAYEVLRFKDSATATRDEFIKFKSSLRERYAVFDRLKDII